MNELPDVFEFHSIEQLHVCAVPLRQRILNVLIREPLTVTQVAEKLGMPPAKVHYHVRELEGAGILRLVETREKGGILEKYYRAVARSFYVPPSLFRDLPADRHLSVIAELLNEASREFLESADRVIQNPDGSRRLMLDRTEVWLTHDDFDRVSRAIEAQLEPYSAPQGNAGEQPYSFFFMAFRPPREERTSAEASKDTLTMPRVRHYVAVGSFTVTRDDLEGYVRRGEVVDLWLLGICTFSDEIPPDLVDRAVRQFHHRGILAAPPDVRAALEHKR